MSKIPFKDKKRVSIFLTEEKERELKKKAIDAGVSFSNFLSNAGTISSVAEIKKVQPPYRGGAASLDELNK